MQVLSRCPLEVGSILWLPRSSAYTLTVVAKATFRLAPEVSQLAEEQDPVIEADSYWDEDEGKSLAAASDLVPRKRHPEVLLVGHAYAPKGAGVGGLVARLTVCEIDKAIEITGDRHFKLDGSLSHPARFSKMPLRWERAAGGPDTSNPVGVPMGEEARPDGWGRVQVPNLIPSGRVVASRDDIVPPACFAPIAPAWPTRVTRLHRHAASFSQHGWHARPLPADLDLAYFNAAPQDQYLRELLGTERFTLENLHPLYPLLTTRLMNVAPRATVDWGGGSSYEVPLACDTLLIDTDRCVATLTFRAEVPLDYPERQGWVIVTSDTLAEPEIPAWIHEVKDHDETMAQPSHVLAAAAALPFGAARTGAQPPIDPSRSALPFDDLATGALPAFDPAKAQLPFDEAAAGFEPATGPQPRFEAPRAPLPFGDASAPARDEDYDEEETFASVRGDAPFPVGAPAPAPSASSPPAPVVPPKVPQGPRLGAFRLQGKSDAPPPAAALDFTDAPTDEPPDVEPPPMFRRAGTVPMPSGSERASDAGLPFGKPPPGKVQPGKLPPGKIAPMKPGVPPPPPSQSGRAEPPRFGFGRQSTLANVAAPASSALPFGARDSDVPPDSPPQARARTLPTPGLYPAPAMPFGPPPGETGPMPQASAVGAAETLPGPMSFAALVAGPPGTPFAQHATPPPTPFAQAPTPPPGAPFAPSFGGPMGVLAPPPGMTIGEMIPAARASTPGMTIGELVAQQRLPIEPPRPPIEAPSPESTQDVALPVEPPPIVEPPRIGPLATPEMVASDLGLPEPEPPPSAGPPSEPEPPKAAEPEEPAPLPLEKYPLERCARIAASVARSREKKVEILKSHDLDDARWEPLRTHWLDEIKKDTERGKTEKLKAYDAAFVAQLEEERGPIAVEEYARIVISAERGTTNAVLAELKLPEGSMLRIQRVWMGKMGKDPDLRRLVQSAVESASES